MTYPTDPNTLSSLAPIQWERLLAGLQAYPPRGKRSLVLVQGQGTADRRAEVKRLKALGIKQSEIAKRLGVSAGLVSKIVKGER